MRRKILLFLVLICGFSQLTVFAQNEKEVAKIRAEVNLINKNLESYTRKTKNIEGLSLEGAEAVFYTSGTGLKKIMVKMYGESYNATAEIYYNGNVPIFIYQKFNKYDLPIGATKSPKIVNVEETRVYYTNERIVRILVGKEKIKSMDEKFEDLKKNFDDFSEKLFKAFRQ